MNLDELNARLATLPVRVIRLVGDGARALASAWAREVGAPTDVHLGDLPNHPDAAIWLDDQAGARSIGDQWVAIAALEEQPWRVLLTGRAVDAGHPEIGVSLKVPTGLSSPPYEVRVHRHAVDESLEEQLERATNAGHSALALTLLEELESEAPQQAICWRWIELWRLRRTGRLDACTPTALALNHPESRGPLMAEMTWVGAANANPELVAAYARAARQYRLPMRVQQDLAYLVSATSAGNVPLQLPGTGHVIAQALAIRQVTDAASGDDLKALELPIAALYSRQAHSEEAPPRAWLAFGMVGEAARIHANLNGPSSATAVLEFKGQNRFYFAQVRRHLEAHEPEAARALLQSRDEDFRGHQTPYAIRWVLLWGRVCAWFGDNDEVIWASERLQRLEALLLAPVVARQGLPDLGGATWATGRWLTALLSSRPDLAEEVLRLAGQLPERPISLGPFELEHPIATGSSGTIWRARHVGFDRAVAVKVLKDVASNQLEAFRNEVEVACQLDHPCIATVLDRLEIPSTTAAQSRGALSENQPALVMELLEHGSLADLQGELPWVELQAILLALLDALAYIHSRGVVHRDLKPENVMLGANDQLRLCDFGLVGIRGRVAGTPAFMPPEQFQAVDLGPEADVYALGCTGWALATGLPPFLGSLSDLARAHRDAELPAFEPFLPMPEDFQRWLRTCLQKRPQDRFRTAAEAAEALLQIVDRPEAEAQASRAVRRIDSPTFYLPTLLDLPPDEVEREHDKTATLRTLHEVFAVRASSRPRLPTTNLLHTGDPPLLWQEQAQTELWTRLLRAQRGRLQQVQLVSTPGQGRHRLLQWLARKARISGLRIHTVAVPGALSVVDATGTEPSSWIEHRRQPWLLVWRIPPASPLPSVQMHRLTPLQTWHVLDGRAMFISETAARAAVHALGSPSLGIELIKAWHEHPGVRMTPRGLQPMRTVPDTCLAGRNWWRDHWTELPAPARELARRTAVWHSRIDQTLLAEEDVQWLPDIAFQLAGSWTLAPDLGAWLAEEMSPEEQTVRHLEAAAICNEPLRSWHLLRAAPTEERTLALAAEVNLRMPSQLDPHIMDDLATHLAVFLVPDERAHLHYAVSQASLPQLHAWVGLPGDRGAMAAIALSMRRQHLPPGGLEHIARDLARRSPDDPLRTHLIRTQVLNLSVMGRKSESMAALDAGLAVAPAGYLQDTLIWLRMRFHHDPDAFHTISDPAIIKRAHGDAAHYCLELGDFERARRHLDASLGVWSVVGDYNLALCLLQEGNVQAAGALGHQAAPILRMQGRRPIAHGLLATVLLAEMDEVGAPWEVLARNCPPITDLMLANQIRRHLADRAPSPRRELLLGLLP